jgi:hypothetical protein
MSAFKKIFSNVLVFLFLISPLSFVQAQGPGGGCDTNSGIADYRFDCVVGFLASAINQIVYLLIGAAIVVFLWGLLKYIMAGGDAKVTSEARSFMVFGIIALFVMLSVWGLTNLLIRTFFPSGGVIIPQFS